VRGVTDLMVMPGLINLDFADIRTVMSEMGKAMMGTGEAEGERRAVDAAEAAISNPLLEDVSMKGARGVLINITGGLDMTLFEVDEAANRVREEVDPNANIIFGSTFDEKLAGKMRISVVATGIDGDNPQGERQPTLGSRLPTADPAAALRTGYTQPMLTQNAVPPPRGEARAESPQAAPAAEAAESAALRSDAFIAPKPVDPGVSRQVPLAHPAVPAPSADAAARPRSRGPSLIERVTGVGRTRVMQPAAPALASAPTPMPAPAPRPVAPPSAATAPRPVQPRLAPLEPEERTGNSKEDDLLDIPAFLRRQAN
jgi:cell division protein FtsZ